MSDSSAAHPHLAPDPPPGTRLRGIVTQLHGNHFRAAVMPGDLATVAPEDRAAVAPKHQTANAHEDRAAVALDEARPWDVNATPIEYLVWIGARFKKNKQTEQSPIVVGDRVTISVEPTTAREASLVRRHERTTVLSRPAPRGRGRFELVLVANADRLLAMYPVGREPLRVAVIDRFLIAAARGGLAGALCLNKMDLAGKPGYPTLEECERLATVYRSVGVEVFLTSATEGIGVEAVRDALAGSFTVTAGHSGAGKSTLLNALTPELDIRTRPLNRKTGKGTHTTTSVTLHRLPFGAAVVDTPGVREFGFSGLAPNDVYKFFPEMEELGGTCPYRNCSHGPQQDACEVVAAVESGDIDFRRYESYLALRGSLEDE